MMLDIVEILKEAVRRNASDVFITVGVPPMLKVDGVLVRSGLSDDKLNPADTQAVSERLMTRLRDIQAFQDSGECDFAMSLPEIGRFRVERHRWRDVECVVAGTGYTGEDGVEVAVPADSAAALWEAVTVAGFVPAGLGARDTLRLEAGLPLHGHELGPGINPLEAGLGWVVRWDKGDFIGRDALLAIKEAGVGRRLRGLTVEGRRPPRDGYPILRDGEAVAAVSSGNFSPTLGHGIALALLPVDVAEGDRLAIDVRGTEVPATVVPLPFVGR